MKTTVIKKTKRTPLCQKAKIPHLQDALSLPQENWKTFPVKALTAKLLVLALLPAVLYPKDYLIFGEKAGSKPDKAQQLGVIVLSEQQFWEMIFSV